jgi:integrase
LPLAKVDQDALDRGARKLFPDASAATRNRQFYTPASAVLHHAARRGWCALLERPQVGPDRIRWLTIEEANQLIDSSSDHLQPLLIFLFYTGARAGEAPWLDWRNVDLTRAHVIFP